VSKLAKIITGGFVGIAAVIGVLSQMSNALDAWCAYFGFWCTYEVASPIVTATIQGGNPCSGQGVPVCIEATTKYRRLSLDTMKFEITKQSGPTKNGKVFNVPDTASGWFHDQKDPFNSSKICIQVFAVTGACEVKPSITGQLKATERITIF
jgi:hypothetical protein